MNKIKKEDLTKENYLNLRYWVPKKLIVHLYRKHRGNYELVAKILAEQVMADMKAEVKSFISEYDNLKFAKGEFLPYEKKERR